jgi:hypothetical protein
MAAADLRKLTVDDFERRKDETFTLKIPQLELPLKLSKATRLGESGRPGGAFALYFLSAPGPFLPQAIYPLEHAELGRLDIFLVPLGPREGGNLYESIFT